MGLNLVCETCRLQGAQRLIIDANGAWVVNDAVELFNHGHAHPGKAQGVGQSQAHGPGSHNQNITFAGFKGLLIFGIHYGVSNVTSERYFPLLFLLSRQMAKIRTACTWCT